MKCKITLIQPSLSPIRFVEYKRSFIVRGSFECDEYLPNNCVLRISLLDEKKKEIRYVQTNVKNGPIYSSYPKLVCYPKGIDDDKSKLNEFGFASLCVDSLDDPESSLYKATNKCWYNDYKFEGLIISASNKETGALFDDGFSLLNDENKPYHLLEKGIYTIRVSLKGVNIDEVIEEKMVIDSRKEQIICRFNPESHHNRMVKWCDDNHYVIIKDTLPGYLEPYMGAWYYHMGLKAMYNANDLPLYENQNIRMFVYLLEKDSTSYRDELSYVQTQHLIEKGKFKAYHYDIGEANVLNREARILEFKDDETISICRIDIVNEKAIENAYYLDERGISDSLFDLDNIIVKADSDIGIMGVVKPYQQDEHDYKFNAQECSYEVYNYPKTMVYEFEVDGKLITYERNLLMERILDKSIGKSVYEFYNLFHIAKQWKGKRISVKISCLDAFEKKTDVNQSLIINVSKEV